MTFSSYCEDYTGCNQCGGLGYYLISQKPEYGGRSYKVCEKCETSCETGTCQDNIGCGTCRSGYTR